MSTVLTASMQALASPYHPLLPRPQSSRTPDERRRGCAGVVRNGDALVPPDGSIDFGLVGSDWTHGDAMVNVPLGILNPI